MKYFLKWLMLYFSLSDDMFNGLESLQVLTVAHNRITALSPMSLHPLHNLHALVLSHNLIGSEYKEGLGFDDFDKDKQVVNCLKGKKKLRSLSVDHNYIKHLPR